MKSTDSSAIQASSALDALVVTVGDTGIEAAGKEAPSVGASVGPLDGAVVAELVACGTDGAVERGSENGTVGGMVVVGAGANVLSGLLVAVVVPVVVAALEQAPARAHAPIVSAASCRRRLRRLAMGARVPLLAE